MNAEPTVEYPRSPFRFRFREIDERAGSRASELPLLSVSVEKGVVLRNLEGGQAPSEDISHYKVCTTDDIAVNRLRAFQGGLGVADQTGLISPAYAVLRFDDRSHPRYVHYLMRSHWFVGQMTARVRGVGGVDVLNARTPHINVGDIGAIDAPEPPLEVQRRVADMLDVETARIDTLIEKNREAQAVLQRRVDASISTRTTVAAPKAPLGYLADVFVSGVDKHSHPDEVPVRLCNYTDIYYGSRIGPDVPFMQASCSEQEFERLALRPGDVVLTKDSETADDIGIPAIIAADLPDLVLGYHNALIRTQGKKLDSDFLYWFLRSQAARDYFAVKARGVTRVGLRNDDLRALKVPLPPLEQQRQVAAQLWEEHSLVGAASTRMDRQVELLKLRRQALVTAAVTGQIEV